ncbi:hypothetical protein CPB86DRAFT_306909 [Serendipita vermifera]|nr:hypothetical protein CPB86DRAFT_306909 [Serendipita vermifera]
MREFHEKRRKALENMEYLATWEEQTWGGNFGRYEVRMSSRRSVGNLLTHIYQICDGIFAQSIGGDPAIGTFNTLLYRELISPQSRKKGWVHKWEDLGMGVMDFSFWAQGDLQVLVEPRDNNTCRRVHFRTISMNEPHPKCAAPYVDIFKTDCIVWENCCTVAYEDRIAFRFYETEGQPRRSAGLVIDSKESKIIMPYMLIADISFLSREEMLLLFNQDESITNIAVYSLPLQRIVCRCLFPFPKPSFQAMFLTRPESTFGGTALLP